MIISLDVMCEGDDLLRDTIAIAFAGNGLPKNGLRGPRDHKDRGATHYAIYPPFEGERDAMPDDAPKFYVPPWKYGREPRPQRLVFFQYEPSGSGGSVPFPFVMDAEGAADFARRWLRGAEYPKQPDTDGDNHRGWRVANRYDWIESHGYGGILAVAPAWITYGK